ncbi:Bodo-specific multi-copy gene family, putative [Bodo saltans]|uniref:Bodo-specific multi-copy gene family, putative n=1 Tax=Bodo saltans TaxID=75058 RepID=A0A0S4IZD5_BODSA|nr:Bodo-specific multi-copy gene family, putative [Bodo saltans]|eukprot:CUG23196.1 Bodo-specific multi-copy gene family, putative [Bodo saltans]
MRGRMRFVSLVHQSTGKKYTLLEALCDAVPPDNAIFVLGSTAEVSPSPAAVVTNVGPLAPLSKAGYVTAARLSWETPVDKEAVDLVYLLAGGSPCLLRYASERQRKEVSLACGGCTTFASLFKSFISNARSLYQEVMLCKWFPYAYTCLLASSTKARVASGVDESEIGDAVIPVHPSWKVTEPLTYHGAAQLSFGVFKSDERRFFLPPVVLTKCELRDPAASPVCG